MSDNYLIRISNSKRLDIFFKFVFIFSNNHLLQQVMRLNFCSLSILHQWTRSRKLIDSLHRLLMLGVFVLPMFLYQPIQSFRFAVESFSMTDLVFVKCKSTRSFIIKYRQSTDTNYLKYFSGFTISTTEASQWYSTKFIKMCLYSILVDFICASHCHYLFHAACIPRLSLGASVASGYPIRQYKEARYRKQRKNYM